VAVALVIIANAPAVLMDPLFLAIAQIRINTATSVPVAVTPASSETMEQTVTSAKKTR
jgi:hypothetical protein